MRLTIALALLALSCVQAQEATERDIILTRAAQQIGQQIGLEGDRLEAFTPIHVENLQARVAVLEKHGITAGAEDRPGVRTLLALRRDLRAVDEDTRERLFPLLTEDELEAYQAAVEEQREQNRSEGQTAD